MVRMVGYDVVTVSDVEILTDSELTKFSKKSDGDSDSDLNQALFSSTFSMFLLVSRTSTVMVRMVPSTKIAAALAVPMEMLLVSRSTPVIIASINTYLAKATVDYNTTTERVTLEVYSNATTSGSPAVTNTETATKIVSLADV